MADAFQASDPSRWGALLPASGAVLLTVGVCAVYAHAIGHGRRPTGHPWSGISLSLIVVNLLCSAVAIWKRRFATRVRRTSIVLGALTVVSAFLWLTTT